MVKKNKKSLRRHGGMISRVASNIAQTAALEYAQRRGPQIIKHAIDNPINLNDPSIYITGRKSPPISSKNINIGLIKPIPIRINNTPVNFEPSKNLLQMSFKPINNHESFKPINNDENFNPNIMKAGRSRRHKKYSKKTRKRRI